MFGRLIIIVAIVAFGLWLYVRFSPEKSAQWHKLPNVTEPSDTVTAGSFLAVRRMQAPAADVLAAIDKIATATPRTRLVAGQVDQGMMTYQTRSLVFGFPDHTTVGTQGDLLIVYGRLRIGQSDFSVNKARVLLWLDALGPLTEPV